jgi:hypothetical protein
MPDGLAPRLASPTLERVRDAVATLRGLPPAAIPQQYRALMPPVAGTALARTPPSADDPILFWHRGLGLSDIALGHALLEKSARTGIGQKVRFA